MARRRAPFRTPHTRSPDAHESADNLMRNKRTFARQASIRAAGKSERTAKHAEGRTLRFARRAPFRTPRTNPLAIATSE